MSRPSYQFYPGDDHRDPELSSCSLASRGLWQVLKYLMHESTEYGYLLISGKSPSVEAISRHAGATPKEVQALLRELEGAKVFSRRSDGVVFCRRMLRDEAVRRRRALGGEAGAEHGKKAAANPNASRRGEARLGGRPRSMPLFEEEPPTELPSVGGSATPLNGANGVPPNEPPPSSSSSSSSSSSGSVVSESIDSSPTAPEFVKPIPPSDLPTAWPKDRDIEPLRQLARIFVISFANAKQVRKIDKHVADYASTLVKARGRSATIAETWDAFCVALQVNGKPMWGAQAYKALDHLPHRNGSTGARRYDPNAGKMTRGTAGAHLTATAARSPREDHE